MEKTRPTAFETSIGVRDICSEEDVVEEVSGSQARLPCLAELGLGFAEYSRQEGISVTIVRAIHYKDSNVFRPKPAISQSR